jgi:hypothetical protein
VFEALEAAELCGRSPTCGGDSRERAVPGDIDTQSIQYSTIMTESDVQLRSVPVVECAGRLIGPDVISYQSLDRQI